MSVFLLDENRVQGRDSRDSLRRLARHELPEEMGHQHDRHF